MRIELERQLPCPPEVAFGLITVPALMNLWSSSTTRVLRAGDGDHPGGVGALREVEVPGLAEPIEEVVEVAEPPGQFGYRVVGGAPVRTHQSRVHLSHGPRGTHLRWRIDVDFAGPAGAFVSRWRIEPELRTSLDALVRVAREAEPAPLPPYRNLGEATELAPLFREAEATVDEQRALVYDLEATDDPKAPLARVHADATALQVQACRAGRFQHPAWVLRLVPRFHRYHVFNLERARRRLRAEDLWQQAFETAATGRELLGALELALRAHVESDLPRALAETYVASYARRCDFSRFRADFLTMGRVLEGLGPGMFRSVEGSLPLSSRIARRVLPEPLSARSFARRFAQLIERRRRSFDEGGELAELLTGAQA